MAIFPSIVQPSFVISTAKSKVCHCPHQYEVQGKTQGPRALTLMARFFFLSLYFFCAFLFCKFLFSEARLPFSFFLIAPFACRSNWATCTLDDELARRCLKEVDAFDMQPREREGSEDEETV